MLICCVCNDGRLAKAMMLHASPKKNRGYDATVLHRSIRMSRRRRFASHPIGFRELLEQSVKGAHLTFKEKRGWTSIPVKRWVQSLGLLAIVHLSFLLISKVEVGVIRLQ